MTFIYYFLLCGLGYSVEVDLKRRSVYFSNSSEILIVSVCNALIMPHFDYCGEVWDSLGSVLAERLVHFLMTS